MRVLVCRLCSESRSSGLGNYVCGTGTGAGTGIQFLDLGIWMEMNVLVLLLPRNGKSSADLPRVVDCERGILELEACRVESRCVSIWLLRRSILLSIR